MDINEILDGALLTPSVDEQKTVLEQMKERKVFELDDNQKGNFINFLCDKVETELSTDYLFHVLDNEVSYPIDDEQVKTLFSDDRMQKLKDVMMEQLNSEDEAEVDSDSE